MTQVYVDNTNALLLEGLHDELTATYINDATVTVTVKDADGVAVTGASWPKTMTYVTASNGNYRAILEDVIDFVAFDCYTAYITANGGPNRVGSWKFSFTPSERIN